jgi:hypothetical protein
VSGFSEAALHEAAAAETGFSDFGEPSYLEGLRVGLEAVARRGGGALLEQHFAARARVALIGRLHSERSWRTHPEHHDTRIAAPLIITGMSRSGTSALHQLFAADPQFQWIPHWIAAAPTVRPPRGHWEDHPAYQAQLARLESEFRRNPQQRATHNIEAALPEECINVMCQSFVSMMFTTTLPLPSYYDWLVLQDETPSYERYARNLKLIGASTSSEQPWLLKNPSHTGGMAALLKVFPDARIVVTHRDPVAAVTSAASMTQIISGKLWAPGEAGRHRLAVSLHNITRLEQARIGHEDQFHDVRYRDFMSDPMAVIAGIYGRFKLTLTPSAERAMQEWVAANPQGKFGAHRYTPEEYGLSAGEIRALFAGYIARHGLDT